MKRFIWLLPVLICSFLLLSFSSEEEIKDKRETFLHDGYLRTYFVHLPANYNPARKYPLVFGLHGGGGKAKAFNRSTNRRLSELADEENFIVVYPQGVKKSWNDNKHREPYGAARKLNIDDVGFFRKLIDKLERDYSIDSRYIFSCGISNGGLMSLTLAAEIPEKIRAIGMVASNFGEVQATQMSEAMPFSLMIIHGTEDPIFPYNEGNVQVFQQNRGKVLGVDQSIAFINYLNTSDAIITKEGLPNPNLSDNCTAFHIKYLNSYKPEFKVELIKVIGGGHTWPGGFQYLPKKLIGEVSKDFNAADKLWEFFESHIEE
jgi:polyhydroxybutyrate depolymerase